MTKTAIATDAPDPRREILRLIIARIIQLLERELAGGSA